MHRVAALVASLAALAAPAGAAADDTIHPGDFLRFDDAPNNIWCTAAFVLDGTGLQTGKVYIATAKHCIQKGDHQEVRLGSGPDNGATDVAGATGGEEVLGSIALTGQGNATESDWALIEVRPELHGRVRPELRAYPAHPTGVATPADMKADDALEHVGYGIPFFVDQRLRDDRQGIYLGSDGATFRAVLAVYGGDSGGPIVHAPSGKAVGILNGYTCNTLPETDCSVRGATVGAAIAQAAKQGVTVQLRAAGQSAPTPTPGQSSTPAPTQTHPDTAASAPAQHPAASPAKSRAAARRARAATCRAKAAKVHSTKRRRAALKRCRRLSSR